MRSISARFLRAGAILLAGWLVLEFALLQLVAARIGWGATLAFLSIKGGVGLFLVAVMLMRGFRGIRGGQWQTGGPSHLLFGVFSGILITLPGLVPPLAGIALFAPSARKALLARFVTPDATARPSRKFDLDEDAWREVRRRKIPARRASSKASLETKPPSV